MTKTTKTAKTTKPTAKAKAKPAAAKAAKPKAEKPKAQKPEAGRKAAKPDLRDTLLLAALPYVEIEGWSEAALRLGAEDAGVDESKALALFPESIDLVKHFTDWADRAMLASLTYDETPERVRDRIGLAVQRRLEELEDYKYAVKQALACFAKPWHATEAARCLYGTVDTIWTYAGDTSTDYNFYTKRALLAGVYSATLLRWLTDTSENHEATWDFLERRIDHALKLGQLAGKVKAMPSPLEGLFGSLYEKVKARCAA